MSQQSRATTTLFPAAEGSSYFSRSQDSSGCQRCVNMIVCDRTAAARRPAEVQSCDWMNQLSPGSEQQISLRLNNAPLLTNNKECGGWRGCQLIGCDCSCPVFSLPRPLASDGGASCVSQAGLPRALRQSKHSHGMVPLSCQVK